MREQLLWVSVANLTIWEVSWDLNHVLLQSSPSMNQPVQRGVLGTRQQAHGWTGVTPSLMFVWGVNWIIHETKTNSWIERRLKSPIQLMSSYKKLNLTFLSGKQWILVYICYTSVKYTALKSNFIVPKQPCSELCLTTVLKLDTSQGA